MLPILLLVTGLSVASFLVTDWLVYGYLGLRLFGFTDLLVRGRY
jgi:hypothetical protein